MEKEVVLDSYIYVSVKENDTDKPDEEIIEEAKAKVMKVLEDAGLDCQFFKEEVRDK